MACERQRNHFGTTDFLKFHQFRDGHFNKLFAEVSKSTIKPLRLSSIPVVTELTSAPQKSNQNLILSNFVPNPMRIFCNYFHPCLVLSLARSKLRRKLIISFVRYVSERRQAQVSSTAEHSRFSFSFFTLHITEKAILSLTDTINLYGRYFNLHQY